MHYSSAESPYGMPRHSGGGGGGGGGGDDYEDDDYDTDGSPMVSSIGGNVWAQGSEILQSTSEVIRSHSPLIVLVCLVLLSFSLFLTQSNMGSLVSCREELSVADKVKVDLLSKNSDAVKEKQDSVSQLESIKEEMASLEAELEQKRTALKIAEEKVDEMKTDLSEIKDKFQQKTAQIARLDSELSSCHGDRERLEEDIAEKHKVLELANSHLSGHLDRASVSEGNSDY